MKYPNSWQIGDWSFYEVEDHGFTSIPGSLFAYEKNGARRDKPGVPKLGEFYDSIEHAMAAAIAEKYTGTRGAGGTGVGTAADWFMKMIGADRKLVKVSDTEANVALANAMMEDEAEVRGRTPVPPFPVRARWMRKELERAGLALGRWSR